MNVRTLSDGPTTRQKILVVSIWLFSCLFGVLTCMPEKFAATPIQDPITEKLLSTSTPFNQDQDYAKGTLLLSGTDI